MKKSRNFFSTAIVAMLLFASTSAMAQTPFINLIQPTEPGIEWVVGGTYLISWTDNFQSTTDILLSSDGGSTYTTTLALGVTGSTWSWSTSGLSIGSNYKIKVQSSSSPGSYYDVSTNKFALVDGVAGTITLNQPTGNESIPQGSTYLISWNDNITAPVKVELLENNVLKTTISASTTGTTLNWTVPTSGITTDSKIYKIKISSTVAGSTTAPAISGRFTITASTGTFVEVLQPNGGETWAVGTSHLISWNDDIGEVVNIQLKNGSTYTDIATGVSGSTFVWNIPSTEPTGTNCKVKISSSLNSSIHDFSNSRFSITASTGSFINVIQPNGGESWAVGTSHLISWNDDFAEAVNIRLKKGSIYTDIATGVTGSTYVWNILSSQVTGSNCKVQIINTLDGSIHDYSDSRFSLTASAGTTIEVLQPNGGESWARGTSHLISWNDDFSEPVDIKLIKGGVTTDIASNVTGSTYVWDIPSTQVTGANFKVKIFSTLDGSIKDKSNTRFSITASAGTYVEVLQPNGGESWAVGTTHLISWIDDLPEAVDIKLVNGSTTTDIVSGVTGSTYSWDIPSSQATNTHYKVKIVSTLDNSIYDRSDANFAITASTGTFIEVIQPNGGESWARGNDYMISWNDDLFEDVNIKLVKGGVVTDIADNVSGSTYTWSIPSGQAVGGNYKIKIISSLDPNVKDYSDANFSITASSGTFVTVIQPNGGESWAKGTSHLISWNDDFTEAVDIKLKRGGTITTIASGVSGSTYTWNIPSSQATASNYKVKIYSTLDATIKDYSDANFTISATSMVSVYPNPANQNITLNMKVVDAGSYTVVMYDRFNNAVFQTSVNPVMSTNLTIPTATLPNGVYFISVTSDKIRSTQKVIIQH